MTNSCSSLHCQIQVDYTRYTQTETTVLESLRPLNDEEPHVLSLQIVDNITVSLPGDELCQITHDR